MAALAVPHEHGALRIAGKPVFRIDGRSGHLRHVDMAYLAQSTRILRIFCVAGRAAFYGVNGMAEEDIIGLLQINEPLGTDLAACLDIVLHETDFLGSIADGFRVAFRT